MADQQTKDEPTDKAEPDLLSSILDELPLDRLKSELQEALTAVAERAIDAAGDKVTDLTSKLTDVADGGSLLGGGGLKGGMLTGALKGGLSSVKDKAKDALTGGGGGGGGGGKPAKATKATNIIESIDVGVPVDVAYDQWTQFQDFPSFMKKVESVEQQADEKITWKAKIVWSHRTWEATILEQVPDERIVWRSKGEKGHVDGSVTFHELAPSLTRILVVLEYYPQGLFERVGNIWRAQGRRARLELKHFRRHVMTRTILNADDLEGWRGEIHDSQVTRGPDEEEPSDEYDEDTADDQDDQDDQAEDEYDDEEYDDSDESDESDDTDDTDESDGAESDGDADEDELGDEYDDEEYDDAEEGDDEAEDEYDDQEDAEEDDEPYDEEDEYDEDGHDDADADDADADDFEDEYDDEEDVDDEADEDDRPARRRAS